MEKAHDMHEVVERGIKVGNESIDRCKFGFYEWVSTRKEWCETVYLWERSGLPHEIVNRCGYSYLIQTGESRRGVAFTHSVIAGTYQEPVKAEGPHGFIHSLIKFFKGE